MKKIKSILILFFLIFSLVTTFFALTRADDFDTTFDIRQVALGNLDGDSELEVITLVYYDATPTYKLVVYEYNGTSLSMIENYTIPGNYNVRSCMLLCDADGDTYDEIVTWEYLGGAGHISVYDFNSSTNNISFVDSHSCYIPYSGALAAHDFDSDGVDEIISQGGAETTTGLYKLVNMNLTRLANVTNSPPHDVGFRNVHYVNDITIDDIDDDGDVEVVVLAHSSGINTGATAFECDGSNLIRTSYEYWQNDYEFGGHVLVYDFDNDGYTEIAMFEDDYPLIRFYNQSFNNLEKSIDVKDGTTTDWWGSRPIAADLNNDGDMEIISNYDRLYVYNYSVGEVNHSLETWSNKNKFSVVNIDNDSELEILVPVDSGSFSYIYVYNFTVSDVLNQENTINVSDINPTGKGISVGDIDNDNKSEIVLVGDGGILVKDLDVSDDIDSRWYQMHNNKETINSKFIRAMYIQPNATITETANYGTSVVLSATLTEDGDDFCDVWYEYGTTLSYGNNSSKIIGKKKNYVYTEALSTLDGKYYYCRLAIQNSNGTVYISCNFSSKYLETYVDDDYTPSTPGWNASHFDNIQDGVDAAATYGTVYVYNGTYNESVHVNTDLTLIGEDRDTTIIDGKGSTGIDSGNATTLPVVNISGFTIRNATSHTWTPAINLQAGSSPSTKIKDSIISDCIITESSIGIDMTTTARTEISYCYIHNNTGDAIYSQWSSDSGLIHNNTITDNGGMGFYGYALGGGSYYPFTVRDNYIRNCSVGCRDGLSWLVLSHFKYNTIVSCRVAGIEYNNGGWDWSIGNTIVDCPIGVWLHSTTKACQITENNIYDCDKGIYIESGYGNDIWNNNLINNTIHAQDDSGKTNAWNAPYPTGGNYYDDYTGVDYYSGVSQNISGGDGIGDTPYNISGTSEQDKYPFITQYQTIYAPSVTTNEATNIDKTTATLNGILTDDGNITCSIWFQYGTTIAYGTNTTIETHTSPYTYHAEISGLITDTTYHYRAVARNLNGTVYGLDKTFHTHSNPTAYFSYTPLNPYTYEYVTFTDKSTDLDGTVEEYDWDFGDGYTSTTKNPTHAYLQPGTYSVKLKVTDDDDLTDTYTKQITITDEPPPALPPPPETPPGEELPPEQIPIPEPPEIPEPKPPEYPEGYTIGLMYELLKIDTLPTSNNQITVMVIDSGIRQDIYTTTTGALGIASYEGIDVDLTKVIAKKHPSFTTTSDNVGHGTFINFEIAYLLQQKLPNSIQISYRVFGDEGETTNQIFLDALHEAETLKPDIISISMGSIGHPQDIFSKQIQKLRDMGIIIICAAGNYGPSASTVLSPGSSPASICVGSFDFKETMTYTDDTISRWSSRGPTDSKPDCVAPGESIQGPWKWGEFQVVSGTSMATPIVTAGTAVILAQHKDQIDNIKGKYFWDDDIIPNTFEEALEETCIPKGNQYDWGSGIPQFNNLSRVFKEKLDELDTQFTTYTAGSIGGTIVLLGAGTYLIRRRKYRW